MEANLKEIVDMLIGEFDNSEQVLNLKEEGIDFVEARHVNSIVNDKIKNLPVNFDKVLLLEESYYQLKGNLIKQPHLFMLEMDNDRVVLNSFELPSGYTKDNFNYNNFDNVDFNQLTLSKKFTPAIYEKKDNSWEGGSESQFSDSIKFILKEKFTFDYLEVSECIYNNDIRTFGFDYPIIYKKIK